MSRASGPHTQPSDAALAFVAWGSLGGGKFKTAEQLAAGAYNRKGAHAKLTDSDKAVAAALEKISLKLKYPLSAIAMAYFMHKSPYVFPVVGCRTVDHLKGNIDALKVKLTPEDVKEIEAAYPFELGFPHNYIGGTSPEQIWLTNMAAKIDYVKAQQVSSVIVSARERIANLPRPSSSIRSIAVIVYRSIEQYEKYMP